MRPGFCIWLKFPKQSKEAVKCRIKGRLPPRWPEEPKIGVWGNFWVLGPSITPERRVISHPTLHTQGTFETQMEINLPEVMKLVTLDWLSITVIKYLTTSRGKLHFSYELQKLQSW